MYEKMFVFLPCGKALTFTLVEILVDDVNRFIFTYVSRGTEQKMKAVFQQANIVGYSTFGDKY